MSSPPPSTTIASPKVAFFRIGQSCRLVLQVGDITKWSLNGETDAIVTSMLHSQTVDAIHAAAGPDLLTAIRQLGNLPLAEGEVGITPGFNLPVSNIIHAVAPTSQASLTNTYRNSLATAQSNGIKYIAFPAISCGLSRFHPSLAALKTCKTEATGFLEIHFVFRETRTYQEWLATAKRFGMMSLSRWIHYSLVVGPFDVGQGYTGHKLQLSEHDLGEHGKLLMAVYIFGDLRSPASIYPKLYEFRVTNLHPRIVESIGSIKTLNIPAAVMSAFERVDKDMIATLKVGELHWALWASKLYTTVVIIHNNQVYTIGLNPVAHVFLLRAGKPRFLAFYNEATASYNEATVRSFFWNAEQGFPDPMPEKYRALEQDETYVSMEPLQPNDAYLVIASVSIWDYIYGTVHEIVPVLQSRINEVGLVEACKAMVGRVYDQHKIISVVTLEEGAHLPAAQAGRHAKSYPIPTVKDHKCYLLPWPPGTKSQPADLQLSRWHNFFNWHREPCDPSEVKVTTSL